MPPKSRRQQRRIYAGARRGEKWAKRYIREASTMKVRGGRRKKRSRKRKKRSRKRSKPGRRRR